MLKLKRFDKSEWFDVPGYEGVRFLIRSGSFNKSVKLLGKIRHKVKVEKEFVDDFDAGEFALVLFKESLVDFEGIVIEGEDVKELTKDQQKEILYEYDFVRNFVASKSNEMREELSKDFDGVLKNSMTSQDG